MNTTHLKKPIQLLNRFKGFLILGLILIVPVSALVIKDPFKMFVGAAPDSVNLYFSPASVMMPPNSTVSLLMDSRTNRVVFARVSGTFDRSKLQLTSEIQVNPKFTVLSRTTSQEANTTGTFTIVGIIYPQAKTIAPPSGLFSFATFSLRSSSSVVNDSASVAVNMSNSQIVSLEADTIPLTTQPLAIALNAAAQTPTPTPTATATPGTSPTPTPTTIASATPAVTPSPSPLSLVMGLGMNEGSGTTTFDSSTAKNNGTLLNGALWSSTGKFGKSVQFDGVDDRIQVADANSLDLNKTGTIEAWVYPTKVNSWSTLVIKEAPQTFSYVLYGWWYGNNTAAVTNRSGEKVTQGGGQLPLNQWTHVAMTFDGSAQTLYINGTVAATSAMSGELQNSTFPLSIGGNSLWANESFQGKIDEVRVYNMAVPQSKIQSDMTTPIVSPTTQPSPSLTPSTTPVPTTQPTTTSFPSPSPLPSGSSGLLGEYFEAADPANAISKIQRVDATVNFNWGSGSPDPAIRSNNFSVRWSGAVIAPVSGQYEFYTESDDGVRLWINNSLKIWDWSTHSVKSNRTIVTLEAGKSYPIKLEYFEASGRAVSRLLWKVPGQSKTVIPATNLRPASSSTTLLPPPSIITATPLPIVVQAPKSEGLVGSYFNMTNFTELAFTRVDSTINFDWGLFSPDLTKIGPDTYSIEWNGYVLAPADGEFTFSTVSDDGVRLWVNNVALIDDWQDHQASEKTGTIRLNVGKKYPIKLQYYDNAYNASIRLRWSGPNIPLQIIPSTALSTQ